jgi:hypothetical protein
MGVAADQAAGPAGAGAAAPAPAATNFDWTTSVEPHAARRRAILAKYGPQVRALYGTDAWTGVQVCWVEGGEEGGSWDGGGVSAGRDERQKRARGAVFFFFSFVVRGSTAPRGEEDRPASRAAPARPRGLHNSTPAHPFGRPVRLGLEPEKGGAARARSASHRPPPADRCLPPRERSGGASEGGGRAVAAPAGAALWEGRPPGPRSRLWDRLPAVQVPDADGGPPTARARDRVGRGGRSPVPGREQKTKKTGAPAPVRRASPLARRPPPPTHTSNRPFLSPSLPLLPPS